MQRYIKFLWVFLIFGMPSLLYSQSFGSKNPCAIPTVTISPSPVTICVGGQVGLTASGATTYVWTPPGSGLSCYNCSNPIASPTTTTTYTVVGTVAGGCSNTATVIVTVDPAPVITITAPKDSVCVGGNLVLTASGGNTYVWTDGSTNSTTNPLTVSPTVTTTYTVVGTDANGCTATATFTVYVSDPVTLMVVVNPSQSICPGNTVTLNAIQTSGSASAYKWEPGGSTTQSILVSPTVTTVYTVFCTNACGTITKNITITVFPVPTVAFSSNPTRGCFPLCIQFKNLTSISMGSISTYKWTYGNGDTTNTFNPIYCYPKPGAYNVSLTAISDSGCSSTLNINNMITVYSRPVAKINASPQPATILQSTIQFTNESTDVYGIITQNWSFGDNGDSTFMLQNPAHTYKDTGTYCVKLGVMNAHGCTDTTTDCITIDPIFTIYIPSAFSPNGDGLNDVFTAKGNDVKAFEMYIFNRWGTELFHCTDMNEGWNGRENGNGTASAEDLYLYQIYVTDNKGVVHSYTGNVTLIK